MNVLMLLGGLFGAFFVVYFIITCLGGFLPGRRYELPDCDDTTRIAVIIPARNEAAVVPKLVESLRRQRYPDELYDVFVVPNNCTDDTEAAALKAGAQILSCAEPVHRKGDALRQAFAQLLNRSRYDAYCIFDADNLVHPGFLHQVNDAFRAGYDAVE